MCHCNMSICPILQARWKINLTDMRGKMGGDSTFLLTVSCVETYLIPVIVFTGVFSSVFTCIVLTRTNLKNKFFSHFLVGISVSSFGFLSTVLVNWLHQQRVPVFSVAGLCQMTIFCSHFFPFLSFWLSVVGAILILLDLKRVKSLKWMTSPTASKSWVIGLSILSFTLYSYKTWTYSSITTSSMDTCTVIPENKEAMEVLGVVDLLLLLCLPSVSFLVFDVCMVLRTCLVRHQGKVYKKRHKEVLKIILCYCVFFHLLVSPRAISATLVTVNKWVYQQQRISLQELAINHILQILFYVYFAINPLFPFCVSKKFRRNLFVMWSNGCSNNFAPQPLRPASPNL